MSTLSSSSSSSSSLEFELLFGSDSQPLSYLQAALVETRFGVNQIPLGRIVFAAPGGTAADTRAFSDDAARCQPGSAVTIKANGQVLFSGVVQKQSCQVVIGRWELTLKLRHPLQRLVATRRNQLFEKMSDKQVLQKMLQDHQISQGQQMQGLSVEHPQMIQFGCSDWQFIKARLGVNGVWLVPNVDGGASVIEPKVASGRARYTLYQSQSAAPGGDVPLIEEASWQFNGIEQPGKLSLSSWDVKQQAMTEGTQANPPSLGIDGLDATRFALSRGPQWLLTSSLNLSLDERKAAADSRLLALRGQGVQASFRLMGTTEYQLGETLALSGFGTHFSGTGIISSVQHKITRGYWRTTVTLGQDTVAETTEPLLPTVCGLHIGVVGDYEKDPDDLNRLRVKVPALSDKPIWARFTMPYASKGSGLCLYPEPGDEIVVGFFAEDPRYPVILGSMHNPENKAPFLPSKENGKKGLVFTKDDKVRHVLFDMEESSLSLVYDKDSVELSKGVKFESEENNIKVIASGGIVVDAKEDALTLKGKKKIQVISDALELTGNNTVKVKGGSINLG